MLIKLMYKEYYVRIILQIMSHPSNKNFYVWKRYFLYFRITIKTHKLRKIINWSVMIQNCISEQNYDCLKTKVSKYI